MTHAAWGERGGRVKLTVLKLLAQVCEMTRRFSQAVERQADLEVQLSAFSRGEIVKACPHCHMHDPGWDEMAGCYRCINCCQTSDAVENWQRV